MTTRHIRLAGTAGLVLGFAAAVLGVGRELEPSRFSVNDALIATAAAPLKVYPQTSWPMFGGSPSRNMVNTTDRLPRLPKKGPDWENKEDINRWTREWVLWKANLGVKCHRQPVVAGGKVFVSTDNNNPRNPRDVVEACDPLNLGVLMCFDERTGQFLWQALSDKFVDPTNPAAPIGGLCSAPTVEGDRLYFVDSCCTVVCADVNGLTDGRQGAVVRKKYSDPTDADIYWEYDMGKELNVVPHNRSTCNPMPACSPLIVGDLVFVCTSEAPWAHKVPPSPNAPSFIALNKLTGKLVWKDNSPGKDIMRGQWASPAYSAEPVPQVIFPGGDGWLRAFDPPTGKLLWQFDGNPKVGVFEFVGEGTKDTFIASPVISGGRLYIGIGFNPDSSDGIGSLWCIDLKKAVERGARNATRDVSLELVVRVEKQPKERDRVVTKPNPDSAAVWMFGGEDSRRWTFPPFKFGRTISNATVVGDILYISDLCGRFYCLNAKTGHQYWQYETKSSIWGSCYYVDGKVIVGNDAGELYVWRHVSNPETIETIAPNTANEDAARAFREEKSKRIATKYLVAQIQLDGEIRATPCVSGGMLYVATHRALYALGKR